MQGLFLIPSKNMSDFFFIPEYFKKQHNAMHLNRTHLDELNSMFIYLCKLLNQGPQQRKGKRN